MKKLSYLLTLFVLSFVVISCDNEDEMQEVVSVNPPTLEIGFDAGSIDLPLYANTGWTASVFKGGLDWLTVTPNSGTSADEKITLTYEANEQEKPRTAEVKVFSQNTCSTIKVTQAAKPPKVLPTIAQLRALYVDKDVTLPADYVIRATVISDFRKAADGGINNNSSAKNIVLSDGKSGIQIRLQEDNSEFAIWDEVEVDLSGLVLTKYQGAMQVDMVPKTVVTKIGTKKLEPKAISVDDLLSNKYESMYVAISDVQVAADDLNKTYATASAHGQIKMITKSGKEFELFSSKYSVFKDEKVPQGSGIIKGIAGININKSNVKKIQIILTSLEDVADLKNPRFAVISGTLKSIADVRALFTGSPVTVTDDIVIKGLVVSDYRRSEDGGLNNSTSAKTIVIQDATAGIQLRTTVDNKVIARGDSVMVSLKGLTIKSYNNNSPLQVDNVPIDNIGVLSSGNTPVAKEVSVADFLANKYESMYITVKDVQVSDADLAKTFVMPDMTGADAHTSISVVAKSGETFAIFSSKYSVYKSEKVPQGSGSLSGIAGYNVSNGVTTYQLSFASKSDYAGLTGPRFEAGPIFMLNSKAGSVWGDAGTMVVELSANVAWSAVSSDPDVQLSKSSGNGSERVTITFNDNPYTDKNRVVTVTFTTTDPAVTENELVYTLTQSPYEVLKSDAVNSWMELPTVTSTDKFAYVSNHIDLAGKSVRNYSIWYDTENRVALWVAYPLYADMMGSVKRTDSWSYDPKVPRRNQGVVTNSYGVSGYDRGHQLPSADRTSSVEANKTTFYFTNIVPQNSDLNQGVWGKLETKIRDWAKACDTLYVVTGVAVKTAADPNLSYMKDNNGNNIAVPKGFYKVLLRYKKDITENNGYSAIGFWYDNKSYDRSTPVSVEHLKSVKELEQITGFNFFENLDPTVANVVEASKNGAEWGLN